MGVLREFWRKKRGAAVGLLAVLALAAAWGARRWWKSRGEAPAAVERVTRGDLDMRFKESGEVAPKLYVDVASKVSGRVLELKAEEGEKVRRGQALAVIQPGRTESEKYVPSTVPAPIAGVAMRYVGNSSSRDEGARWPRVGDYATGLFDSQTPTYLMTVADLSRMIVRLQISEMDILKLSPGMAVTVEVDALPGKKIPARVSLISPQAEKNSAGLKVFKVEVELSEGDARLKPGMTARVDALLDSRKGVLKVPLAGVFEEEGRDVVYAGTAEENRRVEVTLGLRGEMEAELLKGDLKEGETVLSEKPAEKKGAKKAAAASAGARKK